MLKILTALFLISFWLIFEYVGIIRIGTFDVESNHEELGSHLGSAIFPPLIILIYALY